MLGTSKSVWGFDPRSVSGCSLWLDAADTSSMTLSGSSVTQWNDKSGNGLNVSAASSQPTYVTNGLNGLGTLAFNGGQNLSAGSVTAGKLLGNTGGSSTFCVFSVSDNTAGSFPISWDDGSYTYRYIITWDSSGIIFDLGDSSAGVSNRRITIPSSSITFANNTYYLVSFWQSGGSAVLNVSGGAYTITTSSGFTGNIPTSTSRTFNVGTYVNTSTYNMKGNIAEVLIYNNHIPSNFRQIEGYLAHKWGLSLSIPSTHPFYSLRPHLRTFQPNDVPGCQLWLDGADTSSMTFSGSAITQWRDKSGSSNHFTPTSGTPTSISDNGKTVVNFTSGTIMRSTNQITFTTSSALFIVSKITGVVNWGNMLIGFSDINGSDYSIRFEDYILRGTRGNANNADFVNDNYFINGTFNPSFGSSTYLNTYSLIATVAPQGGGTSYITLSSGFMSRNFVGNIAEFLYYPSGVTNLQRQQVEGYLAHKWGLSLSIPSTHPFKSFPPASLHTVVIPTTVRLINLGTGSGGGTSGSFTMNSLVGGGTGTFTNSDVFMSSGQWGMAQCFDGARSDYDLYMTQNPNFMELVFPTALMVTKIFLVPRNQGDGFPSSLTLKANGSLVDTFTPTTVSQSLGMGISYSGTGYYIQPARIGTTWRFDFTSTPVSFGEIEFWGYLPT
jgi:hypothetical protein